MKGPWTFALFTIGIVLLSGDYFSGDNIVGVLAILSGVCRFIMQTLAATALAQIAKHGTAGLRYDGEKRQWLPPAPPKRYTR